MPLSLRIPPEKEKMLKIASKRAGKTKSAFIVEAIDEKLGIVKNRKKTIQQLAGWLTHEEAEELRTSLDVLNQINDVWIAASCMEVGGCLPTIDKHFDVVDQSETIVLGTFSNEPNAS